MINFTQTASPGVIDVTLMVFMALFFAICYLISDAMLSYDKIYTNKKAIVTLVRIVLFVVGVLIICYIITSSIDAGIEWQKLRM